MKDTMELEVDFGQLLRVLKKRAKYIILITMVFAVFGMTVAVVLTPPVYQAKTKMIINAGNNSQHINSDQWASSMKLVETCAVLIRGSSVLQPIIDALGLPESCDQLAGKISVESVNDTPVMQITVKYSDPELAKAITAQITEVAPPLVKESIEGGSLKSVESVTGSTTAITPSVTTAMIKYGAVGFVLSAALFVVLFLMDNTFHTERELRRALDLPVLGIIPSVESCSKTSNPIDKRKVV